MTRHVAIYLRVSTKRQDTRSQEPDLKRWAEAFGETDSIVWYRDQATGKTMDRPGWRKLEATINAGHVSKLVCWRLDRLGRTASGLTALFDDLRAKKINLVSVRDGLDLETPAGRLMANVLASVAAYENEVRSERILAGQAAARASGKRWGGSRKGQRSRVSDDKLAAIRHLHAAGKPIAAIARAVQLSRPTLYAILSAKCADAK